MAGSVRLEGGDAEKTTGEQAHFVGHANAVKTSLTVAENVAFWARYLGGQEGEAERLDKAMTQFAVQDLGTFPAAYLSAGQKRRLGLTRLLVAERPLWLLDEPTVSLDAASTRLLSEAVNAHLKRGGIVIAATHLPLGFESARELNISAQRVQATA
jgi:heme exporter protein A